MANKKKNRQNRGKTVLTKQQVDKPIDILSDINKKSHPMPEEEYVVMRILKNPIFSLVFGGLLSIALFFLSSYNMEPFFTYSDPYEIINIKDSIPNLYVEYSNSKIENLYKTKVVIWNSGNRPIDKTNLTTDNPIQIIIPDEIQLLSYDIIKTSRPSLRFTSDLNKTDKKSVRLFIEGDEAIEKNDGVVIEFYYSGLIKSEFKVIGRIKGVKEGFTYKSWENSIKRGVTSSSLIGIIQLVSLSIIGVIMYYKEVERYIAKLDNNLYYASFCFFPVMSLNFYFFSSFIFGLSWV